MSESYSSYNNQCNNQVKIHYEEDYYYEKLEKKDANIKTETSNISTQEQSKKETNPKIYTRLLYEEDMYY
jgi:hypothetical protein